MKVGITQRVDVVASYGEVRDGLDQNWFSFLQHIGIDVIPIPNNILNPVKLFQLFGLEGLILSGGNDISTLPSPKNNSAKRDETEIQLIQNSFVRNLPIIGVCRGMQLLALQSGEELSPISNHIAKRHKVKILGQESENTIEVNSFHGWALRALKNDSEWKAKAIADDGSIEAIDHKTKNATGIMWHPEREANFNSFDIELFKSIFRK